jgi:carboxymethylenebutenolidase
MSDAITARTVQIESRDGMNIEAYQCLPEELCARGGVVVLHHMPGYDRATKEIVRRFGDLGYDAICPNLFWRDAPGANPDDASATARANGGVPDARLLDDVAGALAYVRKLPSSNRRVGVIGFCSGGRQSVLVGCNLDVNAVVDCYGAVVTGQPPEGSTRTILEDQLPNLRAPLLGLFGADDIAPSPAEVRRLDDLLNGLGLPHSCRSYEGAGHAFFAPDRVSYRVAAAREGWAAIEKFFADTLGA